jgi:hypothetical protein
MTSPQPPRLALALLERFVPDSGPVSGDLVEEFERRPSRPWFWWQVLVVIAMAWFSRPEVIRPLQLVDLQPSEALERSRKMSLRFPPVNLTASPLYGIGGLGLVGLALLTALVVPGIWWALLASALAGVALGIVMIARQRHRAG